MHDGEVDVDGVSEILELYNSVQRETYLDVDINPNLSGKQKGELQKLMEEYSDIFTYVPGRTNLVKHEVLVTSDTLLQ